MNIENLRIENLIIHEIFQIGDNKKKLPPILSSNTISVSEEINKAISTRIIDVARKSLEMRKDVSIKNSAFDKLKELSTASKNEFILISKEILKLLDEAQQTRNIKDSAIFMLSGTVGYSQLPFSCLIKAEFDNSFRPLTKGTSNEIIDIETVESFLGKEQKLYKLIIFMPIKKDEYTTFLFDSNLSYRNTTSAAKYFYQDFLGADFINKGGVAIEQFVKLTSSYINSISDDFVFNINLLSTLIGYVRSSNNNTLNVEEFSKLAFDSPDIQQEYVNFMSDSGFPQEALIKDQEYASKATLKPKLKFDSGISISGNINDLNSNLISITEDNGMTTIKVKGIVEVLK
jgi:hypothetical protein